MVAEVQVQGSFRALHGARRLYSETYMRPIHRACPRRVLAVARARIVGIRALVPLAGFWLFLRIFTDSVSFRGLLFLVNRC